jgi:hypothetical protein
MKRALHFCYHRHTTTNDAIDANHRNNHVASTPPQLSSQQILQYSTHPTQWPINRRRIFWHRRASSTQSSSPRRCHIRIKRTDSQRINYFFSEEHADLYDAAARHQQEQANLPLKKFSNM